MNWLLPEHIADALPREAAQIESLRRRLLDHFRVHGYEFVMPPLLEYLDSLLSGAGQDLDLRTFKIVDQLSGRTMGVRADMTPQVARIDAHLLNRQGVSRLCYCDSVLHTLPASMTATREPIQAGAELYGFAGLDADVEVIRLMADSLHACGLTNFRIDAGHVGVFKGLLADTGVSAELEAQLFAALQGKDVPALTELVAGLPAELAQALVALPALYGGREVLVRARAVLPAKSGIVAALAALEQVLAAVGDLPIAFDLADLRGYHYHSGIVFAAYAQGFAGAVALGGRYDGVGQAFGRARPATGFSLDLRELARLVPASGVAEAILAPSDSDPALLAKISEQRHLGQVVIRRLPGELANEGPRCTRQFIQQGGQWVIVPVAAA
ncbi:MAG TPA: ATP phosphoribosyltransferase regulatory subunit [Rhodocyclaceae bacterium]|nr:ATP phosphoribosyltransferase regulatory subunit [Rhodocyclaceae bacterium]